MEKKEKKEIVQGSEEVRKRCCETLGDRTPEDFLEKECHCFFIKVKNNLMGQIQK